MDPLVDYYNKLILDPMMRSFYGESGFYNVGFRANAQESQSDASAQLLELLLSWVASPPGRILDVACGLGATTLAAKTRWPSASVTGINISSMQLEHARRNAPTCDFLQMDATHLTFPEESFDLILCIEAAFHFDSRRDFLREAFRTLKKGGKILLADILFHDLPEAERVAVWPVNKVNAVSDLREYLGILQETGFMISDHLEGLEPCWLNWCENLQKWVKNKHAEGVLDDGAHAMWESSISSLSQAVKSYPLVCATKE